MVIIKLFNEKYLKKNHYNILSIKVHIMNENIEKMQKTFYFLYNLSKFLICYNYSKITLYVLDYIEDFSSEYKKNVTNVMNIIDVNLSKDKQTKKEGEGEGEGEELNDISNKKEN